VANERALVAALEARLRAMRAADDGSLWTDEALRTRPEWAGVRRQAAEALHAIGWEVAAPLPLADFYRSEEVQELLAELAGMMTLIGHLRREPPRRAARWPWERLTGWLRRRRRPTATADAPSPPASTADSLLKGHDGRLRVVDGR
jgi:hypothetical protein